MTHLCVLSDSPNRSDGLRRQLADTIEVRPLGLDHSITRSLDQTNEEAQDRETGLVQLPAAYFAAGV